MAEKRKDSKGRVLQKGEHERTDGRYHYLYLDAGDDEISAYAKLSVGIGGLIPTSGKGIYYTNVLFKIAIQ